MIDRLAPVTQLPSDTGTSAPRLSGPSSTFSELLSTAIQRVELSGTEATKAAEGLLTGQSGDVHSAALAAQRASLQFEYFLQVRNKVVQAYQEIMRMQL